MERENREGQGPSVRFVTARRTMTETDIVTFINLAALHEPIFADVEFVRENMPPSHHRRFSPAPLVISMAMGLVAPIVMDVLGKLLEGRKLGPIAGMTGLSARVKAPVYPGDTLKVEGEAFIEKTTDRGHTLVGIRHVVKNQAGNVAVDFTETIMYMPPEQQAA